VAKSKTEEKGHGAEPRDGIARRLRAGALRHIDELLQCAMTVFAALNTD
jgi:hypothetical protein